MSAGRALVLSAIVSVISAGCASAPADMSSPETGPSAQSPLPFLSLPVPSSPTFAFLGNQTWRLTTPSPVDLSQGLTLGGELKEPGWVLFSFPLNATINAWEGRMNYSLHATGPDSERGDHFIFSFFPVPVTSGQDPFMNQVPVLLTGPLEKLEREVNRMTSASSQSGFDRFFMFLAADTPVAFRVDLEGGGAVLPPSAFGTGTLILDRKATDSAPVPFRAGTVEITSAAPGPGIQLVGVPAPYQPLGPVGAESGEWLFTASFSNGAARTYYPGTGSRPPTLFGTAGAPAGTFRGEVTGSKLHEAFGLFTAFVPFDTSLVTPEYEPSQRVFSGANSVEEEPVVAQGRHPPH